MDKTQMIEAHSYFTEIAKKEGFYSEELMKKISEKGTVRGISGVPEKYQRIFATSHDVTPEWHIRMQAAFQKYTDNAVSKTVNFPHEATEEDVRKVYMMAYDLGCKGVTIYRDRSRESQVLNIEKVGEKKEKKTFSYNYAELAGNGDGMPKVKLNEKEKEMISEDEKAKVAVPAGHSHVNEVCPDCQTDMEIKEGCSTCPKCGYSACSLG